MTQRHPIQFDEIGMVTTNIRNRRPIFRNSTHAREAIETLYRIQELHPFFLHGFVIMPDHCHFLLRPMYPETFAGIMNIFKSGMTFNTGIPKLWQRRYHLCITSRPYKALQYIHNNPVKAGLAQTPEEYPWSSASGRWDVTPLDY